MPHQLFRNKTKIMQESITYVHESDRRLIRVTDDLEGFDKQTNP